MGDLYEFVKSNKYFTESRLTSLYSGFDRLKLLNPDGYNANIEAWINLLVSLIQQRQYPYSTISLSANRPSLSRMLFMPLQGPPASLGEVLTEMTRRKVLVPYSEYSASQINYHEHMISDKKDSIMNYVSPSWWVLRGLKSLGIVGDFNASAADGSLKDETYIVWDVLVEQADEIYKKAKEITDDGHYTSQIFDADSLDELFKSIDKKLTSFDCSVLRQFLSRDSGSVSTRTSGEKTYFKLSDGELTDDDIAIANIKSSLSLLTKRNQILQHRIDHEIPDKINVLLKQKDSSFRIKNLLSLKKTLSASVSKSLSTAELLSTILTKINDATLNATVLLAMKQASLVLSGINKNINLEEIEEIKADLDSEITKTNEINEILVNRTEDEDLDEELAALYEEEKAKETEKSETKQDGQTEKVKVSANIAKTSSDELLNKLGNLNITSDDTPENASEETLEKEPAQAE